MKKMITMIMACICVLTLVAGLTGCGGNENDGSISTPEKAAVCYVIGNTANSQGLNMNSPLVQDTAYSTIRNYGYIAVINVDETPEIVLANSYDIDAKYKSASNEKLDMDARSKATNLIVTMQNVVAVDPETDYLEALRLAVRSMSSLEGYDSKTIIVLGTGLGTSGVLDFRNNLLSAEPEAVVERLEEKEAIPDFTGITVVWQQMGDVAAPQQALTQSQRNKLQQIYGGIIESGNGTFIYNDIMASPVNESTEYPTVSLVELPAETPIVFDMSVLESEPETEAAPETPAVFKAPVSLSEKQVCFIPDSAEYLAPEEAVETIKPIAQYLMDHQDVTLLLAGCIAGDSNSEYGYNLSQQRADAVKNTLIQLGIDGDRLITKGLGCSDPWHIANVDYDGALASANRKVVLLDASTALAKEILGN